MAFLLVKVCAPGSVCPWKCVPLVDLLNGLLWAGRNGMLPTPNTLNLGCSDHLHPSHLFFAWESDIRETAWLRSKFSVQISVFLLEVAHVQIEIFLSFALTFLNHWCPIIWNSYQFSICTTPNDNFNKTLSMKFSEGQQVHSQIDFGRRTISLKWDQFIDKNFSTHLFLGQVHSKWNAKWRVKCTCIWVSTPSDAIILALICNIHSSSC